MKNTTDQILYRVRFFLDGSPLSYVTEYVRAYSWQAARALTLDRSEVSSVVEVIEW